MTIYDYNRGRRGSRLPQLYTEAVRAQAQHSHQHWQNLFGAIRDCYAEPRDKWDEKDAADRRSDVRRALLHATYIAPNLDQYRLPEIDRAGYIVAPEQSIEQLYKNGFVQTPGLARLREEMVDVQRFQALGVLHLEDALRPTRYRQNARYGLRDPKGRERLLRDLRSDGWVDQILEGSLALGILRSGIVGAELEAKGVLFRVVRAKLPHPRRYDAEQRQSGDPMAGACTLTLETLIVCRRVQNGGLFLARVLDEPLRDMPRDQPAADVVPPLAGSEDVARIAWKSLRLVEEYLGEHIHRIAAFDRRLPLGPSQARVGHDEHAMSRIGLDPAADAWRGRDDIPATDVLFNRNLPTLRVTEAEGIDILRQWTVLTVAEGRLSYNSRQKIYLLGRECQGRTLEIFPTVEQEAEYRNIYREDLRTWVVSVPDDQHLQPMWPAAFIESWLATNRAYPTRAAGHRSMLPATNNYLQVSQIMHALLAYALGEELERPLRIHEPAPFELPRGAVVPVDVIPPPPWWTLFRSDIPDAPPEWWHKLFREGAG